MLTAKELKTYTDGFIFSKATSKMDWPGHVHLETLAQCNAACNFCPYPELDRIGTKMPDELIEKILQDLTDIPRLHRFQISPMKVNEPFLDVRLFDILGRAAELLPQAIFTITTNASPLTAKKIDQLCQAKRLDSLWVSFNDHREAEYEATMQIPYARTVERLKALHTAKAEGRFAGLVVLSRVGDNSAADGEFAKWVVEHFPLFAPDVIARGDWLGQVNRNKVAIARVENVPCIRWFELSITATGKVAHCCMDGKAMWSIGDVTTTHVLDVYNAPEYRRLRETVLSRKAVAPCNTCTFY
jgi:hypothetical protein